MRAGKQEIKWNLKILFPPQSLSSWAQLDSQFLCLLSLSNARGWEMRAVFSSSHVSVAPSSSGELLSLFTCSKCKILGSLQASAVMCRFAAQKACRWVGSEQAETCSVYKLVICRFMWRSCWTCFPRLLLQACIQELLDKLYSREVCTWDTGKTSEEHEEFLWYVGSQQRQ